MHGGLTAAIVDESFGFLWLSLRSKGQLPFRGPAFTAHLEVDYKQVWTITYLILRGHWKAALDGAISAFKLIYCDQASF